MPETIELVPSPESVGQARRWSSALVERRGVGELGHSVALVVSELVTNVVLHARTACDLTIHCVNEHVRVEVRDWSPDLPMIRRPLDKMATSGRGMPIVDELCEAHGAEALPDGGKVVWCELRVPASDLH